MDLYGIEIFSEKSLGETALIKRLDGADRRDVEIANDARAIQELAVVNVFDHHHSDEVLVLMMVIEGEFHELPQRVERGQAVDVELALPFANEAVFVLESAEIQPFLVSEVVVDHPLAAAGPSGDLVDARASEPAQRELLGRDFDDVLLGAVRILDACCATGLGGLRLLRLCNRHSMHPSALPRVGDLTKLTSTYIFPSRPWRLFRCRRRGMTSMAAEGSRAPEGSWSCRRAN